MATSFKTVRFTLNSSVCSRLTYLCQNWNLTVGQFEKLDVTYRNLLRRMIRGGLKRIGDYDGGFKRIGDNDGDFWCKLNNEKFHVISCSSNASNFIQKQENNYAGHVVRMPIERCEEQLTFHDDKYHRIRRVTLPFWNKCWSLIIPISIILFAILWNTNFKI